MDGMCIEGFESDEIKSMWREYYGWYCMWMGYIGGQYSPVAVGRYAYLISSVTATTLLSDLGVFLQLGLVCAIDFLFPFLA